MKKIMGILIVVAVLAVGGLVAARQQGVLVPGLADPPLERALEGPLATGDSVAMADFAEARCRLVQGAAKRTCYEEILLAVTEKGEVRLAMDALSVLSNRQEAIRARGHDYTHVVGINAWKPGQDVGAVYERCTGLFQSGCYHGVVQAYLDANGTDSVTVAGLCELIPAVQSSTWLRFQCVHGIGHGLVAANDQHLPRALHGCDWLHSTWDSESCYGGAFMEFIVAGRGQSHHPHGGSRNEHEEHQAADEHADHQAAEQHQDHGEHADHAGMSEMDMTMSQPFAIRDSADPLYPCSALDVRYQRSCYGMQAGIIIEQVGSDFGKIAAACDDAPEAMVPACYQGIGTYVSGFTVRDPVKASELCMMGNPDHRAWCFVGVVKNFIDVTASADDGIDFCQRLTDRALAVACYVAIGEEISVLRRSIDLREQECARIEKPYVDACRYGAALSAPRPTELQDFSPRGS
ncbi:MAG: hypothetical protein R2909_18245 [Gemmatimonadales bacterium]